MKNITEQELHSEFALHENSKATIVTFYCGLGGVICCLALFLCFQYVMNDIKQLLEERLANEAAGPLDDMKTREAVTEKLLWVKSVCLPIFMLANLLWVAGGYAWSFDLGKNPKNKITWRTGGMFVFMTAAICVFIWYWLLTQKAPA